MSRGLGSRQRLILDELEALPPGFGVRLSDGVNTVAERSALRRAAHSLARRGLVTLERKSLEGRSRLVARLR